jgi:hypothetical protein
MKKTVLIIVCLSLLMTIITGCVSVNFSVNSIGIPGSVLGRGSMETFTFEVGEVKSLNISLFVDIEYSSTPSDVITLEIQPNLVEYISVDNISGRLVVSADRNINFSTGNIPVLKIGSSSLEAVSMSGAASFTAMDTISGSSFNFELLGAGSVNAKLDVSTFTLNLAGAGKAELSGSADYASFTLSGAGTVNALDLQTKTTDINLAGVGTVRVSASEALNIIAGGVGTVEYKGNPTIDTSRGGLVSISNVG